VLAFLIAAGESQTSANHHRDVTSKPHLRQVHRSSAQPQTESPLEQGVATKADPRAFA